MYIPYSMDDNEPDLVAPWGSYERADKQEEDWPQSPTPRVYTQHQVDQIVNEAVSKLIIKHQKVIDEYRKEIMEMYMMYEHGRFYDN